MDRAREAINNVIKIQADRNARLAKIAEILAGNMDLSLARKYPIIYADPPWRYEAPPMGAGNRSIENHYPTLSLAEICELPVEQLANDDAILYLWAAGILRVDESTIREEARCGKSRMRQ